MDNLQYVITVLLWDDTEEGVYNKEREEAERKKMTEGGNGNVVGVFPIYCNHLCFGEKHFTHPSGCVCMCLCL